MNIQQMKYVVAVDDHGSFGAAAQASYIGQSTLSTMIARLEDELELKIFDRKYKPIKITNEGKVIIKQLRLVLDEMKNFNDVVGSLKGAEEGEIKIGVIPTVAPYLMPHVVNAITSSFPKVLFEISEMTTDQIIEEIQHRRIDIGILSTPLDHSDLIEHHLYNEPFYLFDAGATLKDKLVNADTIDCRRLWLMDEGHCLRNQVENICELRKKSDVLRNIEYKSGSIDTLMRFVKANKGVTLLPYLATLDLSKADKAFLKSFTEPSPARSVGIVVHRHFVKHRFLKLFAAEITRMIKPLFKNVPKAQNIFTPV